ncbi:hypothetical protein CEUSTIGMA_g5469.t1 [Chlamydomonas eustigma]|uniref:Uncharacterized protein n=1 Tax=Chlamydomonas eustigma TaxID=1157962 RepID=A0A250X4L6_9CHLO|nr:hypothetical protein CEUSTIGMA_g5469.t1 [Chlamydomonas eustigma]|eukprot:GAX78027.1 hypothetical protein CEUSTIGMA_g5469.t1 [Chlamydomonas eustigma]
MVKAGSNLSISRISLLIAGGMALLLLGFSFYRHAWMGFETPTEAIPSQIFSPHNQAVDLISSVLKGDPELAKLRKLPRPMTEEITTVQKKVPSKLVASELQVLIAMIGRDVGGQLPRILKNIERLGDRFARAHVLLVENDSTDNTREFFNAWAAEYSSKRASTSASTANLTSFSAATGKKNLQTLAVARNKYLDALSLPQYAEVDYIIAVDTDMCCSWEVTRMVKVINGALPTSGITWHTLLSNGVCGWLIRENEQFREVDPSVPRALPLYCDYFAFKGIKGESYSMANRLYFMPDRCELGPAESSRDQLQCTLIGGQPGYEVNAGFGGMAMYRADLFRTADGVEGCRHNTHLGGCEHNSLNECIRTNKKGRLFVMTGLIVNWGGCSEAQGPKWCSQGNLLD